MFNFVANMLMMAHRRQPGRGTGSVASVQSAQNVASTSSNAAQAAHAAQAAQVARRTSAADIEFAVEGQLFGGERDAVRLASVRRALELLLRLEKHV